MLAAQPGRLRLQLLLVLPALWPAALSVLALLDIHAEHAAGGSVYHSYSNCKLYTYPSRALARSSSDNNASRSSGWPKACGMELLSLVPVIWPEGPAGSGPCPAGPGPSNNSSGGSIRHQVRQEVVAPSHQGAAAAAAGAAAAAAIRPPAAAGHLPPVASMRASPWELLGRSSGCGGEPVTHGRDFFILELARPGGQVAVRLPARHTAGGVYTFVGWAELSGGLWNATVVLWSRGTPELAGLQHRNMTSALLEVDWSFEVRRYVQNVQSTVLNILLLKPSIPMGHAGHDPRSTASDPWVTGGPADVGTIPAAARPHGGSHLQRAHLPRCLMAAKGEWTELPAGTEVAADCNTTGALCTGSLSGLFLDRVINQQRRFRHVYAPWSCTYHLFSRDEARACLGGKRVLLWGDSHIHQANHTLFALLDLVQGEDGAGIASFELTERSPTPLPGGVAVHGGAGGGNAGDAGAGDATSREPSEPAAAAAAATAKHNSSDVYILARNLLPPRMGVAAVLSRWDEFVAAMTDYDVIIMGSADHDVCDYYETPPNITLPSRFGPLSAGCSSTPGVRLPVEQHGDECFPRGDDLRIAKYRPFAFFLENMARFAEAYKAERAHLLRKAEEAAEAEAAAAAVAAAAAAAATEPGKARLLGSVGSGSELRGLDAQRRQAAGGHSGSPHSSARERSVAHGTATDGTMSMQQRQQGRRRRGAAQVFWLFSGYTPCRECWRTACYPQQLDRMTCLNAKALQLLQGTGIIPIDVATLQADAPEEWWDDFLHVGIYPRNGLQAMSIQVLLNTICSHLHAGAG